MSQFERNLRESLRRRQPPADFAEKVLARTRNADVPRVLVLWRPLAVAALVLLMIGGSILIREQQRQTEHEKAKEQLMVGLRITGSKLHAMQARITAAQRWATDLRLDQ
jgi:hypothetical protein